MTTILAAVRRAVSRNRMGLPRAGGGSPTGALVVVAVLSVVLAACGGGTGTADDDAALGAEDGGGTQNGESGAAAGSCLAGDPDCTDESYSGQDVARFVPVAPGTSNAEPAERGRTDGATGAPITVVHRLDDRTLQVVFRTGACDLVEDVLVEESAEEVRVLVLTGQDPAVDVCTAEAVQRTVTVDLEESVEGRALLDLAR